MKTIFILLNIFFLGLPSNTYSQTENIWHFGFNAGLDFNGGGALPVPINGGKTNATEGVSTVCDQTGNLLFYTDGDTVWDKTHTAMPNGFGLYGNVFSSSAQATLIAPVIGDSNKYYIFTTSDFQKLPPTNIKGFYYNIVDLSVGSNGDVITKNEFVTRFTAEGLTAILHKNGVDYWVIVQDLDTNLIYSYLVDSSGLDTNKITSIAPNSLGPVTISSPIEYMIPSPKNDKIILSHKDRTLDLFDFDNCTGRLTYIGQNYHYKTPNSFRALSCAFSDSGNYLYCNEYNINADDYHIYRYDMNNLDDSTNFPSVIDSTDIGCNAVMKLGPDDNIYFTRVCGASFTDTMSVIRNPEDLNPIFDMFAIQLGNNAGLGLSNTFNYEYFLNLPDFNADYAIDDTSICQGKNLRIGKDSIAGVSYQWLPNIALNNDTIANPTFTSAMATTEYIVEVNNGCMLEFDTVIITVLNSISDTIDFITICENESVIINGNKDYFYFLLDTNINIDSSGVYTLKHNSPGSCTNEYFIEVEQELCDSEFCQIYLPNAFSPNGDGVNDRVILNSNCSLIFVININIYDRWGNKIFETNDLNEGWNGYNNTGRLSNEGVYVYFITGKFSDGVPINIKGNITLIR